MHVCMPAPSFRQDCHREEERTDGRTVRQSSRVDAEESIIADTRMRYARREKETVGSKAAGIELPAAVSFTGNCRDLRTTEDEDGFALPFASGGEHRVEKWDSSRSCSFRLNEASLAAEPFDAARITQRSVNASVTNRRAIPGSASRRFLCACASRESSLRFPDGSGR